MLYLAHVQSLSGFDSNMHRCILCTAKLQITQGGYGTFKKSQILFYLTYYIDDNYVTETEILHWSIGSIGWDVSGGIGLSVPPPKKLYQCYCPHTPRDLLSPVCETF